MWSADDVNVELHLGQRLNVSIDLRMHWLQKVWPHRVMYASTIRSKQMGHRKSKFLSSMVDEMPFRASGRRVGPTPAMLNDDGAETPPPPLVDAVTVAVGGGGGGAFEPDPPPVPAAAAAPSLVTTDDRDDDIAGYDFFLFCGHYFTSLNTYLIFVFNDCLSLSILVSILFLLIWNVQSSAVDLKQKMMPGVKIYFIILVKIVGETEIVWGRI